MLAGARPSELKMAGVIPLLITATGHGSRQKCNVNEIGFPCSKPKGAKKVKGFQTGDMVRAVVTTGTKQGIYVGRVLVRASGSFDIRTQTRPGAGHQSSVLYASSSLRWLQLSERSTSCRPPHPIPLIRNAPFLPRLKPGASWRGFGEVASCLERE